MKKIFLIMFFALMLLPLVSAAEWDNVQDYDEETRTLTVTNALGFGKHIADIQLMTPLDNRVILGEDRLVAQYEIFTDQKAYPNIFKKMELFDVNNGMRPLEKEVIYRYAVITEEEIEKDVLDCEKSSYIKSDGSIGTNRDCTKTGVRTFNRTNVEWRDFNTLAGIKEDRIVIGLFADVYLGDKVEWIPTLFGERIGEWAVWTESLNDQITAYYTMNQTGIGQLDSTGNFGNATCTGNVGTNCIVAENGLINYSVFTDSAGAPNGIIDLPSNFGVFLDGTYTVNLWVNFTSIGVPDATFVEFDGEADMELITRGNSNIDWGMNGATPERLVAPNIPSFTWVMVTIISNTTFFLSNKLKCLITCHQ